MRYIGLVASKRLPTSPAISYVTSFAQLHVLAFTLSMRLTLRCVMCCEECPFMRPCAHSTCAQSWLRRIGCGCGPRCIATAMSTRGSRCAC